MPHSDVFWGYRFLEVKDWIVWRYPKTPNNCSCVSKNICCSLHLGKDIWFSWKDFCFYVFVDYISFRFYVKYIWKKCYKNVFRCIFLAPIPFKRYQNTSGCSTGLGILSPAHFVYAFLTKMFLMLYSINSPNLIVWLPFLLEILGNMWIANQVKVFRQCFFVFDLITV